MCGGEIGNFLQISPHVLANYENGVHTLECGRWGVAELAFEPVQLEAEGDSITLRATIKTKEPTQSGDNVIRFGLHHGDGANPRSYHGIRASLDFGLEVLRARIQKDIVAGNDMPLSGNDPLIASERVHADGLLTAGSPVEVELTIERVDDGLQVRLTTDNGNAIEGRIQDNDANYSRLLVGAGDVEVVNLEINNLEITANIGGKAIEILSPRNN